MGLSFQERVETLFADVLVQPPEARSSYLAMICDPDTGLYREVASLLAAHEEAEGFLVEPAVVSQLLDTTTPLEQLGPYHVLKELGHGGMGTVFLAERADGQYEQLVAIKVVRLGAGAEIIARRFQAERQILARLQHPHIATLYDGGTTDDGRPYLVMEYIDGSRIDTYCRDHDLSIPQRIALFRTVCETVQYAHQHFIVHRDIKPDNILITPEGTVKLLDFGIAKLLDVEPPTHPDQTGLNTLTTMGMPVLTPEYASPEQILGGSITTASDVYSLGVVLYELLCGRRPHQLAARSELPVLLRAVCEDDVSPPSAVAPEQRRQLRSDLDAITLRALQKNPEQRYTSVQQLAEDLERYLRGLPVLATESSLRYRSAKFLRRHWKSVLATSLVGLALLLGMLTTTWQMRIAQSERARAQTRYQEVRQLANTLLFELHDAMRGLPGSTRVRRTVIEQALGHLDRLAREDPSDPLLLREVADGYVRLGDVQGNPYRQNLGDLAGALRSHRKALAIRERLVKDHPTEAKAIQDLAHSHLMTGAVLANTGEATEGLRHLTQARQLMENVADSDPQFNRIRLLRFYNAESHWLNILGQYEAARINLRKAAAIVDAAPKKQASMYRVYEEMSALMAKTGDSEAALAWQQQGHKYLHYPLQRRHSSQRVYTIARAHSRLAKRLAAVGKIEQAIDQAQTALKMRQSVAETFPADTKARHKLAGAYLNLAHLYDLKANRSEDNATQVQYHQEACNFYRQAKPLLDTVPDVGIDRLRDHEGLKRLREVCKS